MTSNLAIQVRFLAAGPDYAVIALAVERILGKDEVACSNHANSTNADVAHQVEQQTENLCVVGSSPTVGTTNKETIMDTLLDILSNLGGLMLVLVLFAFMYYYIRNI